MEMQQRHAWGPVAARACVVFWLRRDSDSRRACIVVQHTSLTRTRVSTLWTRNQGVKFMQPVSAR